MFKKLGPGILVAAAFIGPGTVTVCTLAGVKFGFALMWAMLFSIGATILLQEMASRVGLVSKTGLVDVLRNAIANRWVRFGILALVLSAILVGNAAYEAGNIGGAVLGIQAIFDADSKWFPLSIGVFAFVLLWFASYKLLERVFVALVGLMSISFVITAFLIGPSISELFKGLFVPTIPKQSILTIMALVGTTVVPYNIFLHASLVNEKWNSVEDLGAARRDTIVSILLGGVVSLAVMVTATAIQGETITNALDLAKGLEPLYGSFARYLLGIGLIAAGITSAITAPLAAAYVVRSCFDWDKGLKDMRFRAVWAGVLLVGVVSLTFNFRPLEIIQFAQVANGILLPLIALLLLWVVNSSGVMGKYKNSTIQNILGALVVGFTIFLGVKSLIGVFKLF